jgi:hypothetical protein
VIAKQRRRPRSRIPMGPSAADVELLRPRRVDDGAVAVGDRPCPRGPAGALDCGVRERSDDVPIGVDDAHLEPFDGVLDNLDVHSIGPAGWFVLQRASGRFIILS